MKSIVFNTEMVKATLNDRKTQSRKVIKDNDLIDSLLKNGGEKTYAAFVRFSKYKVDDILYVKEKFCIGAYANDGGCETNGYSSETYISQCSFDNNIIYYADAIDECDFSDLEKDDLPIWKPSVHLKQKDARIFLKVTNVRVERLQDISVRNIEKETGRRREIYSYSNKNKAFLRDYCDFWNSTAKDGYKWEDNPYVFVYEFQRVELSEVK